MVVDEIMHELLAGYRSASFEELEEDDCAEVRGAASLRDGRHQSLHIGERERRAGSSCS